MFDEIKNIVMNDHSITINKLEKVDTETDLGKRIIEIEKALKESKEQKQEKVELVETVKEEIEIVKVEIKEEC